MHNAEEQMAKQTGSTRTTISVPAELRRRMDKVKEDVNWSALACRAFEEKLGEIASKKEEKNMSDIIERLRASKRKSASADHKEGVRDGETWAKNHAEAVELELLEKFVEQTCVDFHASNISEIYESGDHDPAWDIVENIYEPCVASGSCDRSEFDAFWEDAVGDSKIFEKKEWVLGFMAGAIDVWRDVKGQL
jgi:hypothetical protein